MIYLNGGVMKVTINNENFSIEEQEPVDTATRDFRVCKLGTSSSVLVKFSIALLATQQSIDVESEDFNEYQEAVFNHVFSYLTMREGNFEVVFEESTNPEDFEGRVREIK